MNDNDKRNFHQYLDDQDYIRESNKGILKNEDYCLSLILFTISLSNTYLGIIHVLLGKDDHCDDANNYCDFGWYYYLKTSRISEFVSFSIMLVNYLYNKKIQKDFDEKIKKLLKKHNGECMNLFLESFNNMKRTKKGGKEGLDPCFDSEFNHVSWSSSGNGMYHETKGSILRFQIDTLFDESNPACYLPNYLKGDFGSENKSMKVFTWLWCYSMPILSLLIWCSVELEMENNVVFPLFIISTLLLPYFFKGFFFLKGAHEEILFHTLLGNSTQEQIDSLLLNSEPLVDQLFALSIKRYNQFKHDFPSLIEIALFKYKKIHLYNFRVNDLDVNSSTKLKIRSAISRVAWENCLKIPITGNRNRYKKFTSEFKEIFDEVVKIYNQKDNTFDYLETKIVSYKKTDPKTETEKTKVVDKVRMVKFTLDEKCGKYINKDVNSYNRSYDAYHLFKKVLREFSSKSKMQTFDLQSVIRSCVKKDEDTAEEFWDELVNLPIDRLVPNRQVGLSLTEVLGDVKKRFVSTKTRNGMKKLEKQGFFNSEKNYAKRKMNINSHKKQLKKELETVKCPLEKKFDSVKKDFLKKYQKKTFTQGEMKVPPNFDEDTYRKIITLSYLDEIGSNYYKFNFRRILIGLIDYKNFPRSSYRLHSGQSLVNFSVK
jgi:hypothetical protein